MNLDEVFNAIDAACDMSSSSDLQENEVTLQMYLESHPTLARSTCERRLAKAVASGKIERRPAIVNGRRCWAYKVKTSASPAGDCPA